MHSKTDSNHWRERALGLRREGKLAEAVEACRRGLAETPGDARLWCELAHALRWQGRLDEARHAADRAVAAGPELANGWFNLGAVLEAQGAAGRAIEAYRRALALEPGFAEAWSNLGAALGEQGDKTGEIAAYERALAISPQLAPVWANLASALYASERYEETIAPLRKAIEINARDTWLHLMLGVALQRCGRQAEAVACFRRVLEIEPDHAQAHWDLSYALLATGELREGWEQYEWRWRRSGAPKRRYDLREWDGDVSKPRRLLLWGEQGVGDQIIYASLVADLVCTPLRITLEVDPRLVPLYARSLPGVAVIPQQDPPAVDPAIFDCFAPLPSLGRFLRPSFECFPRRHGSLKSDRARAESYRSRLRGAARAANLIVGISWASASKKFSLKGQELLDWAAILRMPGARFVDLQYGDTAQEREEVERQAGVAIEHLPDLDLYHDLDGVAALCAACDLVITVSNVTAHVAGALGVPVWLLIPTARGKLWYWFSGRTDSPWYPSLRIFEPREPGGWEPLLDAVTRELAAFLKSETAEL